MEIRIDQDVLLVLGHAVTMLNGDQLLELSRSVTKFIVAEEEQMRDCTVDPEWRKALESHVEELIGDSLAHKARREDLYLNMDKYIEQMWEDAQVGSEIDF